MAAKQTKTMQAPCLNCPADQPIMGLNPKSQGISCSSNVAILLVAFTNVQNILGWRKMIGQGVAPARFTQSSEIPH